MVFFYEKVFVEINFIIFAQWKAQLPKDYPIIVELFRTYGIRVVPIQYNQIMNYHFNSHKIILSITPDLASSELKLKALKRYLNFSMKTGKFTFYDISSCRNFNTENKYLKKYYKFFPLPMKYDDIVQVVAHHFHDESISGTFWPGGRRSKLPYDVTES